MPRPIEPPRLYPRRKDGRRPQWVILDRGREIGTGAGLDDRAAAESALADYLAQKRVPDFGAGHPDRVLVSDALNAYQEGHAVKTRRPDLIAIAVERLVEFFLNDHVANVTPARAGEYVTWRTTQTTDRRAKRNGRPPKPSTARRELVVLASALAWCWREGKLDRLAPVALPPMGAPRERHLTRSEAALLIAGALGFERRPDGTWRRHRDRINRHVARFILVGLYSGTRHGAITALQWIPNLAGGWVDLDNRVIHRRPQEAVETKKRKTPAPIAARLLPHLARWKRRSARFVIEWNGEGVAKMRRGWDGARRLAHLGPDVTPHILRHTCATWLLQRRPDGSRGESTSNVAGVLGCSEQVIRDTYGHLIIDDLHQTVAAFSWRPRASTPLEPDRGQVSPRKRGTKRERKR